MMSDLREPVCMGSMMLRNRVRAHNMEIRGHR